MKIVLTETQIERIASTVNASAIASAEMKDDLIDHLCCIVEDEMSKGKEFDVAHIEAFKRLNLNGLNETQNGTLFLFKSKGWKRIDRMIYVSGIAAFAGFLLTVVMKLLNVPFASLVLMASSLVLLFLFILILIHLIKQVSGKSMKTFFFGSVVPYLFGFNGIGLFMYSAVFAVFDFPGAQVLLISSVVFICIALLFFKIFKKSSNRVR